MTEELLSSQRVSSDQRRMMLDFMKAHPALAYNKFTTPDGAKHKQRLLHELAVKLNSCSKGATKTCDKWLKSWQDWRSDTKSKASKIRRFKNGTGGGPPCKLVLSAIEEELLGVMGTVAVGGLDVPDPLVDNNEVAPRDAVQVLVEGQVQDGIVGEQVGTDFLLPIQDTPVLVQSPYTSPSGTASSVDESSHSSSSLRFISPSPVRKRRRTCTNSSSTESEVEEKILNCTEGNLEVQKEQVKLQKEQLRLQIEQVQLLREQIQLQREQGKECKKSTSQLQMLSL